MSNRTAKFLSAILASLLAGAALATMSHSPTHAADDCLSAPKDQTPGGGHWYYRIDRATKRHCWYLREEGEKLSQTAAPDSSPSARRPAPKAETATQRSIADAHAELPAQTRVEPPAGNDAPNPAIPANAAGPQNSPSANAGDADAQSSVVAALARTGHEFGRQRTTGDQQWGRKRASNCVRSSAARRCRSHARRSGFTGSGSTQLDRDAVERHDRRTGARGYRSQRRFQIRQRAASAPGQGPCASGHDLGSDR